MPFDPSNILYPLSKLRRIFATKEELREAIEGFGNLQSDTITREEIRAILNEQKETD